MRWKEDCHRQYTSTLKWDYIPSDEERARASRREKEAGIGAVRREYEEEQGEASEKDEEKLWTHEEYSKLQGPREIKMRKCIENDYSPRQREWKKKLYQRYCYD